MRSLVNKQITLGRRWTFWNTILHNSKTEKDKKAAKDRMVKIIQKLESYEVDGVRKIVFPDEL